MAKRTRDEVQFLGETIRWSEFHAAYEVFGLKFSTLRAAKGFCREWAKVLRSDDYRRYSEALTQDATSFLSIGTLNALRGIRCFHFGGRFEMPAELLVKIRKELGLETKDGGAWMAWNAAWNTVAFMH